MEVLATLRVNDSDTGELLAKVQGLFTCDECADIDEFYEEHADDIEEFMLNRVYPDCLTGEYVTRLDLVELADEPAEVA